MDQTVCGRENCGESAAKFCINCRAMLCRSHRVDDVKKNRVRGAPEHLHVDPLVYNMNPEHYTEYYCDMHHEILIGRCINCGIFSCNECTPEICPKGSGRHHDYDSIIDYVERRYKGEMSEFEKLLQKKNEAYKLRLKEACRTLEKTDRDLQQIMDKVDEEVETQITALRDYGKIFKEEIYKKKTDLTTQIVQQIKVLEQKEMESRNLLASIRACVTDISGIKLVKTYSLIKEETEVLLQDAVTVFHPPGYELHNAGAERSRPLQLELRQTSPGEEAVCEETLRPKQIETEIKYLNTHRTDELKYYYRVSYRPTGVQDMAAGSSVIAGGWDYTERVQGGESTDRKQHESLVLQLLSYEGEMLLLTCKMDTDTWMYTVRGRDSGRVYYTLTDDIPYSYYLYKRIAATSTRQLLVLYWESQTLRIVSLEAGGETEQRLSDAGIRGAYQVLVPSSGGVIVSCESPEGHRLVHYDPKTRRVLWESESLSGHRLCVTQYQEFVYVIQVYTPTHVWRLSLSDGAQVQKIPCSGLPKYVLDMSMRGNEFVVAGGGKGLSYFQIIDTMY